MKINTKVVFEWNDDTKQYEEIYCESYDYNGEVAECQGEEDAAAEVVAAAFFEGKATIEQFLDYFNNHIFKKTFKMGVFM